MKRLDRNWMYERVDDRKRIKPEFVKGVTEFIEFAKQHADFQTNSQIRCPCRKCDNRRYQDALTTRNHLLEKGFCSDYFDWVCHGEDFSDSKPPSPQNLPSTYREMVIDALGPRNIDIIQEYVEEVVEEDPNPQAKAFFEMLNASEEPLYEGSKMSRLEMASRLTNLKCEYNLPHRCVDGIASLLEEAIPEKNLMTKTFYGTKKVVKGLQLPHEKIHSCPNGCMLFWKDDALLEKCKKCGRDRYKRTSKRKGKRIPAKVLIYFPITPRLQRLYATKNVAEQMRWHSEQPRKSGTLAHPSDGIAWQTFDSIHSEFAAEPRNVRLGLCTDGFKPYGKFGGTYSCWPVILTPYNLPPEMCMKRQFMFLTMIVPGPKNPKGNLDVYLQPLIEELKQLWETGASTFDVSKKNNFMLKAALMWTINDFPAYAMLSGWSTAGKLSCPYCMDKTRAFRLTEGHKHSWFDCHRQFLPDDHPYRRNRRSFYKSRAEKRPPPPRLTGYQLWDHVSQLPKVTDNVEPKISRKDMKGWSKQSIFWELPYWKDLLIRHNLDVMHIEKNYFEQLIHTLMDVKGSTADTIAARRDLATHCRRPELEIFKDSDGQDIMPQAPFALDKAQKKVLCEWLENLKFPDGYASNLSRCVDHRALKLSGLKSHDCHVFMERLVPVAFRHLLPTKIWNAITELSQFFRDLCASTIQVEDMMRLKKNIPEILCKLEKIFPPSFFNCMEHLPVHLPYEAEVGGPVQYRWMYPFERFLNHLKKKIGNKARVEGSICNAYLTEEISNFCAQYFEDHVDPKSRDQGRNVSSVMEKHSHSKLPEIFAHNVGYATTKGRTRFLEDKEYDRAHLYILSNCGFLEEYEEMFVDHVLQQHPNTNRHEVWSKFETQFPAWFQAYVMKSNVKDDVIQALAMGPCTEVKSWNRYLMNGFNFHTYEYGKDKATMNYGVFVAGPDGFPYYGILEEIIELCYIGNKGAYETILFKCNWMDSFRGMNIHEHYRLVEVNHAKKYPKYDPFVLGYQVEQVCFTSYPSLKNDRNQWWAVFNMKARSNIDAPVEEYFQEEAIQQLPTNLSGLDQDEEEVEVELEDAEALEGTEDEAQDEDDDDEEEEEEEDEYDSDDEDTDDSDNEIDE